MDSRKPQSKGCKACGQKLDEAAKKAFFPFCSKRCKWSDLGKWFNEEYVVPGQTPPDFELES